MKRILLATLSLTLTTSSLAPAGLIVTDPTLIATNKVAHAKDLAESLIRKANQLKQIEHQLRQILQMDDLLERFGDPTAPVAPNELADLLERLSAEPLKRSSEEIDQGVDGQEVFDEGLSAHITLDGEARQARDPELYLEEARTKRGLEHYHAVQQAVLARRQQLSRAIASTITQLQAATSASEIDKLSTILAGQQNQLAATDKELDFASSEIQARALQQAHARQLRAKARFEEDRAAYHRASRQDAQFYRLMTTPTFFRP